MSLQDSEKLQAGVLVSHHSPGLDTHEVRRDFFYYFSRFHRFFSFVFRITIYVTKKNPPCMWAENKKAFAETLVLFHIPANALLWRKNGK